MKSAKDAQESGTPVRPEHERGRLRAGTGGRGELDRAGFIKTRQADAALHSNQRGGVRLAATRASAVLTAASRDEEVPSALRDLLIEAGRIRSTNDLMTILPLVIARLESTIDALIEDLLCDALQCANDHADIRQFFLQPKDSYSIEELACLWGVALDDVRAVYHDEILRSSEAASGGASSLRIPWTDAVGASFAFNVLRPYDVEIALGSDFAAVQPKRWRTVPVVLRLPAFVVDALSETSPVRDTRLAVCIEQFVLEAFQSEFRAVFLRART